MAVDGEMIASALEPQGSRRIGIGSACAIAVLLAACSSGPQPVPPTAQEASRPAPGTATPAVTPAPARPASSPAAGLLNEARAACSAGDIQTGLARLDRALRIEAGDAALYLEMARCYRAAGDPDRAAAAAERGLAYCDGARCSELREFL